MKKLSSVNILGGLTVDQATTLSGTVSIGGIGTGAYTSVLVRNGSNQLLHRSYNDFVSDITTSINLSNYVPISRTLTINGTTYDLSANRTWTIANNYISNVALANNELTFTGVNAGFNGTISLDPVLDEVRTVYERVKNTSGATIQKGTPLAVVPGQTSGNLSDVIPADAADPAKMPAVYIANETMLNGAEGQAILFGFLHGVDTSLYPSGTTVYVAAGGGWTSTKPVHPNKVQNLGVITKQHHSNGSGVVTGVGRANDLPNLTAGKIWVGSPTYPIESTTVHVDEANGRVGIGTVVPNSIFHISETAPILTATSTNNSSGLRFNILGTAQTAYRFQYGGSTLFQINPNGNVGIGTTNPATKLVVSNGGAAGLEFSPIGGVGNDAYIQSYNRSTSAYENLTYYANDHYFNYGGTTRLIINAAGNVGIGTTSPSYKLSVNGDIQIPQNEYIYFDNTAHYIRRGSSNVEIQGYNGLDLRTNGSTRLFINQSGNVGIGTTSPAQKLHVNSGTTNEVARFESTDGTAYLSIMDNNTANSLQGIGSSGDNLTLYANNAERMRITSSGNVGIGTTSPASKLQVNVGTDQNVAINSTGGVARISAYDDAVANSVPLIINGSDLRFTNNSSEAVRITGGNVGIGTTSPLYKLQVQDRIHIEDTTTLQPKISFSENTSSTGEFVLEYNGVGAGAGNYVSFYSEVPGWVGKGNGLNYVPQNGNVGIGTASPVSKLHISGSAGAWDRHLTLEYDSSNIVKIVGDTDGLKLRTMNAGKGFYFRNSANSTNLIITDSGNVGIGTTSPARTLHVTKSSGDSLVRINAVTGSYTGLELTENESTTANTYWQINKVPTNNRLQFWNGSERLSIDSSGNVGIGTASPSYKLDVSGALRATGTLYSDNGSLAGALNLGQVVSIGSSFGSYANLVFTMHNGGGFSDIMKLQGNGNVGIGTTSPILKLDVVSGTTLSPVLRLQNTDTNGYSGAHLYSSAGTLTGHFGWANGSSTALSDKMYFGTIANKPVVFTTNDSEKVRIAADGNVGIGTTSPAYKLEVSGTLRSSNLTIADGMYHEGDTNTYINFLTDTIQLATSGSVRAYINSAGNVGIGTTSPAHTLDVNGELRVGTVVPQTSADFSVRRNGANIEFGHGNRTSGYYGTIGVQGNNGMPYIAFSADCESSVNTFTTRGFKGNVIHTDSAGNFMFSQLTTANSTGQSLTERMRILANGNVGIGTTAPSEKLQVAGNAVVTTTTFGLATDAVRLENATGDNRSVGQFIGDPSVYNAVGAYGTNTVNGSIAGIKFNWYSQNWMISATRSGSIDIYGLVISQNSTERLVIGNTGNVGIGTTSPSEKLDVVGNLRLFSGGYPYIDLGISTSNYWRIINDNPNDTFVIGKNGASNFILNPVGAATFSSSVTAGGVITATGGTSTDWNTAFSWGNHAGLYLPITGGTVGGPVTINGSLVVNGTITENSSAKLKENVETSEGNLEKVVNLRPVSYNKIGSQNTELGLIAEEVANVYPEFVQYDENGEPVGVHYSRLTAALIGAVKELNEQLQELKKNNG